MSTNAEFSRWYYAEAGETIGPFPFSSIEALARAGHLSNDALIVQEGSEDWQPLSVILSRAAMQSFIASSSEASGYLSTFTAKIDGLDKTFPWYMRRHVVFPFMLFFFLFPRSPIFFFSPLGVILLWMSERFDRSTKMAISAVFGILFVVIVGQSLNSKDPILAPSDSEIAWARSELAITEGLTNDESKLRLIKPDSKLFVENIVFGKAEKTKADFERYEANKQLILIQRMEYENRYRKLDSMVVAEFLEENQTNGMIHVRVHGLECVNPLVDPQMNLDSEWWTEPSNLLPFDKDLGRQAKGEYDAKRQSFFARTAKRRSWLQRTVKIKSGAPLFSDDDDSDALWEWLSYEASGKTMSGALATKLMNAGRMIRAQEDMSGTVIEPFGPYQAWLKVTSFHNGNHIFVWARDEDVTFEEPKPDPPIAQESMRRVVENKPEPAIATNNNSGVRRHVTKAGYLASPSKEMLDKAYSYAVQKDNEALNQLLQSGVVFNLKAGVQVELVEMGFLSGLCKIRPRGETIEIWTSSDAVD